MTNISQANIESELLVITRAFLRELEAERALQALTLDASLERDLGIDSLGKVELLHRIEKTFSVKFSENTLIEAATLRDVIKFLEKASPSEFIIKPQTFSPPLETTALDLSFARTLPEILAVRAAKEPNRPHIYLQKEEGEECIIHYGKLFEEARWVAMGLMQRGIQSGETIAIMLPTSEAFFYAFFGVLLAGAIPIPIYPPFRPDRIEEYVKREAKILQNAEARILITFSQASTLSNLLRAFIPSLKEVTTVNDLQTTGILPELPIYPDDIALIQYTSGSTGDPKGVVLTHTNILANIRAIGKVIPIIPTDVLVSWLPLYHDMGLMSWLGALYFGVPMTILSPMTFLARPERWLWAIHYHRATISGAPNFAYELCIKKISHEDIEGLDLSAWRFAFNGAEAINPDTMARFYKKFSPYGFRMESFAPVYGLAESTVGLSFPTKRRPPWVDKIERDALQNEGKAQLVSNPTEKNFLTVVSCGEALDHHEIQIVDDKGQPLLERMVGNIYFKGPSAMQGYFNNNEATQKNYLHGWWDTGDLGYLANNELFITGRKKDLIIKAGRNLYPEEIENIVNQVADVRKGCVVAFGVSDPITGTEKLIIIAETHAQDAKQRQEIEAHIVEKLAVELGEPPDRVILASPGTIPKTSSGKLQRSLTKKTYLEGHIISSQLTAKIQMIKLAVISFFQMVGANLEKLGKIIYSFYVGILLFITVPFIWMGVIFLPRKIAEKLVKIWAHNIFRLIFCPIIIDGAEKIPKNRIVVFVSNHSSYVDSILLLGLLPAGTLFVAKKELLQAPIIRTFIKKLGFPTVDRLDFSKSIAELENIKNATQDGHSILIFPEGTFTYATGLRRFKLGAFSLAVESGLPICPITIQGGRSILRGDNKLLKPGYIRIHVGDLIEPQEKSWDEIMRLHSLVRSEIAKHCGEPVIDMVVAGLENT